MSPRCSRWPVAIRPCSPTPLLATTTSSSCRPPRACSIRASTASSWSTSTGARSPSAAPQPAPRPSRPGAPRTATARPNLPAIATCTAWSRTQTGQWKVAGDEHPDGRSQRPILPPPDPPAPPRPTCSQARARPATGRATPRAAARSPAFQPPGPCLSWPLDGPFGADAAWVGIGGLSGRDLIQAGTQQSVSGTAA